MVKNLNQQEKVKEKNLPHFVQLQIYFILIFLILIKINLKTKESYTIKIETLKHQILITDVTEKM